MKVIEVYVKSEEVIVYAGLNLQNHSFLSEWSIVPWNSLPKSCYKMKIFSEKDKEAIEIARSLAEKTKAKVKIRDLSYFEGKILAFFKGIKKTPTILIDGKKYLLYPELEDRSYSSDS